MKVKLKRGNSRGTGLIQLPKDTQLTDSFVSVEILETGEEFKAKIRLHNKKPIIYIPKKIAKDLRGEFDVRITPVDGHYAKIGLDGRLYIPNELISKYDVKPKSIIKIITKNFSKFTTVNYRRTKNREEYMCMLDPKLTGKTIQFEIENIDEKPKIRNIERIFPKARIKYIKNKAIISINNARYILVVPHIQLEKYAYYLGAYFADGTKKGNSWALCASSTKQANYYLKNHHSIVLNPELNLTVVYTNFAELTSEIEKKVRSYWEKIGQFKLRIINSKGKSRGRKANVFGTLVIKQNSRTVVSLYNAFLSEFFKLVRKSKNKDLARKFVLGVLEGDGSVSAPGHGHLMITTNSTEAKTLRSILDISNFEYNLHTDGNNASIRINALSILENLYDLELNIFKYYPTRRRLFCERFCNIGICRFLLGKQSRASAWVKSRLRKKGILTNYYRPTVLGKKIVNSLRKLDDEVSQSLHSER